MKKSSRVTTGRQNWRENIVNCEWLFTNEKGYCPWSIHQPPVPENGRVEHRVPTETNRNVHSFIRVRVCSGTGRQCKYAYIARFSSQSFDGSNFTFLLCVFRFHVLWFSSTFFDRTLDKFVFKSKRKCQCNGMTFVGRWLFGYIFVQASSGWIIHKIRITYNITAPYSDGTYTIYVYIFL